MANFHQAFASSSSNSAHQSALTSSTLMAVRTSGSMVTWKPIALFVLMIIVSAEAQTFQYSRGWTNGKRGGGGLYNGGAPAIGPYDIENGLVGVDPLDVIIPPGHLQISGNPQGRIRSLDYNQYLAKRLGAAGTGSLNSRKQPLWFGIVGVDGAESSVGSGGSGSSSTSNSNSNNSPSNSRSSASDF